MSKEFVWPVDGGVFHRSFNACVSRTDAGNICIQQDNTHWVSDVPKNISQLNDVCARVNTCHPLRRRSILRDEEGFIALPHKLSSPQPNWGDDE